MVGIPSCVCVSISFVIEVIDCEVFWVPLDVDLTVICCLTDSFLCFGVVVLPGNFCEGTEPGSNFRLKNDFLISFWWHKTVFKEILNLSLLFCLLIKLHQQLISESNEGNLKKIYASSCVFSVVECIRTSKSCSFLLK